MKRWSISWWMVLITLVLSVGEVLDEGYELATFYMSLAIFVVVANTNRRLK